MTSMTNVFTIARKELRSTFHSPIAMIFLAQFLAAVHLLFFVESRFFARNLADLRPLFEWMPLVLIYLTSAITMRSWAEEKKMGTLEVLMTLPLRTWDLVLGKFTAGVAMVAIALALSACGGTSNDTTTTDAPGQPTTTAPAPATTTTTEPATTSTTIQATTTTATAGATVAATPVIGYLEPYSPGGADLFPPGSVEAHWYQWGDRYVVLYRGFNAADGSTI